MQGESSDSHILFLLATGDICGLFMIKLWVVTELSCKQDDYFSLTCCIPRGGGLLVWTLLCLSCSVSL